MKNLINAASIHFNSKLNNYLDLNISGSNTSAYKMMIIKLKCDIWSGETFLKNLEKMIKNKSSDEYFNLCTKMLNKRVNEKNKKNENILYDDETGLFFMIKFCYPLLEQYISKNGSKIIRNEKYFKKILPLYLRSIFKEYIDVDAGLIKLTEYFLFYNEYKIMEKNYSSIYLDLKNKFEKIKSKDFLKDLFTDMQKKINLLKQIKEELIDKIHNEKIKLINEMEIVDNIPCSIDFSKIYENNFDSSFEYMDIICKRALKKIRAKYKVGISKNEIKKVVRKNKLDKSNKKSLNSIIKSNNTYFEVIGKLKNDLYVVSGEVNLFFVPKNKLKFYSKENVEIQ